MPSVNLSDSLSKDNDRVATNEMGAKQSETDYDFYQIDPLAMRAVAEVLAEATYSSGVRTVDSWKALFVDELIDAKLYLRGIQPKAIYPSHLKSVLYGPDDFVRSLARLVFSTLALKDYEMDETAAMRKRPASRYTEANIPDGPLFAVAKILHRGAVKYGEDNWRGISVRDNLNHAEGHVRAWFAGDRSDDHLGNACCRAIFALAVHLQGGPIKYTKKDGTVREAERAVKKAEPKKARKRR